MRTDYESIQSFDVVSLSEKYDREIEVRVGVNLLHAGHSGFFDHVSGHGEPPCGSEYDVVYIGFHGKDKKLVTLNVNDFECIFGSDITEELLTAAYLDADENWTPMDREDY